MHVKDLSTLVRNWKFFVLAVRHGTRSSFAFMDHITSTNVNNSPVVHALSEAAI